MKSAMIPVDHGAEWRPMAVIEQRQAEIEALMVASLFVVAALVESRCADLIQMMTKVSMSATVGAVVAAH